MTEWDTVFDFDSCSCEHGPDSHDDGFGCTVPGCQCLAGWLFDEVELDG